MKFTLKTSKPWDWGNELRKNKLVLSIFDEGWKDGVSLENIGEVQQPNSKWDYSESLFHAWISDALREGHPKPDKLWWYLDDDYDGVCYRSLKLLWLRLNWTDATFRRETWTNILFNKDWPVSEEMKERRIGLRLYYTFSDLVKEVGCSLQAVTGTAQLFFMANFLEENNTPEISHGLALAEIGDMLL
jgi:hypothetical protein